MPFEYSLITSMFLYGVVQSGGSAVPSGSMSGLVFVPF